MTPNDSFTPTTTRAIGKCMIALGVVFLLMTAWFGVRKAMFVRAALPAYGTVAGFERGAAIAEFPTAAGRLVKIRQTSKSGSPLFSLGETVEVLYPKDQPEDGLIDTFMQVWMVHVVSGAVGLALCVYGYLAIKGRMLIGPLRQGSIG